MTLEGSRESYGYQAPRGGLVRGYARHPLMDGLVFAYCHNLDQQYVVGTGSGRNRGLSVYGPGGLVSFTANAWGGAPNIHGGDLGYAAQRNATNLNYDFGPNIFTTGAATVVCCACINNFDTPTQGTTFANVIALRTGGNDAVALFAAGASGTGNELRGYLYATDGTEVHPNTTKKSIDNRVGWAANPRPWPIMGVRVKAPVSGVDAGQVQAFSSIGGFSAWSSAPSAKTSRSLGMDTIGQYNSPYMVTVAYAWNRDLSDGELYRLFAKPYWYWGLGATKDLLR